MTVSGEYLQIVPIEARSLRDRFDARRAFKRLSLKEDLSEVEALQLLGFEKALLNRLSPQATINQSSLEEELLSNGYISEDEYYATIARMLGLPFVGNIDARNVQDIAHLDTQLQCPLQLTVIGRHAASNVAIVPQIYRLGATSEMLRRMPNLRNSLVITTPSAIRQAVWACGAERRVRSVVFDLFETAPDASARIVASGKQGLIAGGLLAAFLLIVIHTPELILPLVHIVLSMAYLFAILLRILALALLKKQRPPPRLIDLPPHLPRYSVMVALYREAEVVPQLIRSLERLEWPRSRLDIKLVCEADDLETIGALRSIQLPPQFEIVEVPPFAPRTKPKALSYALAGVRGEYLTIYDAEDRPHPKQLLEAYHRFQSVPREVACLQSPLVIGNPEESSVSALFALEYAALFRGLLPMLARFKMPLPLGGTSNHFRTDVLRQVGGWDPFNVTEDADLGMRLFRHGFRAETLRYQTVEDAPVNYDVWLGQRVRWFKGWFQTWLVIMRNPRKATREMGMMAMLTFQLMIGGMLLSALLHPMTPLLLVTILYRVFLDPDGVNGPMAHALIALDLFNVFGSYAVFLSLGLRCMIAEEKRRVGLRWMALPLYWLMASRAAWRAANELRTRPFFWNKTPHKPREEQRLETNET